jgi:hypothetical protein
LSGNDELSPRSDYLQRGTLDADFRGSGADVFAVGVEIEGRVGFDAEMGCGEVVDFADV